jgi:hypothetical protein
VDRDVPTLATEMFEKPDAFMDSLGKPWQWVLRSAGSIPNVGMTCGAPGTPCTEWLVSAASHEDSSIAFPWVIDLRVPRGSISASNVGAT